LSPEYAALQASLLRECAGVHLDLMQWSQARRDAAALRDLCRRLGDEKGVTDAINLLGLAAKSSNQWKRARAYFDEAMQNFEQLHDTVGIANAHNNLGLIEYLDHRGDKGAAAVHMRETLRLRRTLGDARGVAEAFINLGALAQARGDLDEAHHYYAEALDTETSLNHIFGIGRALCNIGEVAEARAELTRAFRCYVAAQSLFEIAGVAYQQYSSERAAPLDATVKNAPALRQAARRLAERGDIKALITWTEE
jgi:tetratricopeptide (TPR) repeat protein